MDWREAASRLEPGIDFSRIPKSVAAKLDASRPVYVACSGGADSVFALLLAVAYLKSRGRLDVVTALHFDHAIRGEASAGDAVFVREMCEGLGVSCIDSKAEWPSDQGAVNEASARESRLAFFRGATGATKDSPVWVATGHHADDVVETVLMRLSRGAGLDGLSAPREISDSGGGLCFLRPLLGFSRAEMRDMLERAGVPWREDETNASDANYRGRLRKQAIAAWESAADRPIRPGVCRSRMLLAEDAEALARVADQLWSEAWDEARGALRRDKVASYPAALQRRLLLRLPGGESVAASGVDAALAAIAEGGLLRREVAAGLSYVFSRDFLELVDENRNALVAWSEFFLPAGARAYLPDGGRISCVEVTVSEDILTELAAGCNDDRKSVYLGLPRNLCQGVTVRRREAGDAFKPLGKSSPKKLKNLFIDRKVTRGARERLPIFICREDGIVWVPGFPPNADRIIGIGSNAALRLTYDR